MPKPKGPVKSNLPPREVEICSRIREVRESLRFSQSDFAEQVGITRESLASYEDARAPLRVALGLRICKQFIVSEAWLAMGLSPHLQGVKFTHRGRFGSHVTRACMFLADQSLAANIPERQLYSAAYDTVLDRLYMVAFEETFPASPFVFKQGDDPRILKNYVDCLVSVNTGVLYPDEAGLQFLIHLVHAAQLLVRDLQDSAFEKRFMKMIRLEYEAFHVVGPTSDQQDSREEGSVSSRRKVNQKRQVRLTSYLGAAIDPSMLANPARLKDLMKRLRHVFKDQGFTQNALSKDLKITRQAVNLWFTKGAMPSGEVALRLDAWLKERGY